MAADPSPGRLARTALAWAQRWAALFASDHAMQWLSPDIDGRTAIPNTWVDRKSLGESPFFHPFTSSVHVAKRKIVRSTDIPYFDPNLLDRNHMSQTANADPPSGDPPSASQSAEPPPAEPPSGKRESSDPHRPKRRRTSTATNVALIGLVGAIAAAIIGLFATDEVTVVVPTFGIGPDIEAIQNENTRLQNEVRETSGELEVLASQLETVSGSESPKAEISRLRAKLQELGVDPDEEVTSRTEVYRDREFELVGSEDSERTAFVDLDTGDVDEMLESEWWDTVDSDGPRADLALSGSDLLEWSGQGIRSSESAAPASPVSCEAAAMRSSDEMAYVSELDVGDVICLITTNDSLARVEIVSANSDDDPPRTEIKATLWE